MWKSPTAQNYTHFLIGAKILATIVDCIGTLKTEISINNLGTGSREPCIGNVDENYDS